MNWGKGPAGPGWESLAEAERDPSLSPSAVTLAGRSYLLFTGSLPDCYAPPFPVKGRPKPPLRIGEMLSLGAPNPALDETLGRAGARHELAPLADTDASS